jgi:mannitol-1-phosphate/altronate dehydrogenase
MTAIVSDHDIFQQFTDPVSQKQYQRTWSQFVDFSLDCLLASQQHFQEEIQCEAAGAAQIDSSHQRFQPRCETEGRQSLMMLC